jgi:hypothetical protein
MSCETCRASELLEIRFDATDLATYRYCRTCDVGWWQNRTETVPLADVMRSASSIEPARRRS